MSGSANGTGTAVGAGVRRVDATRARLVSTAERLFAARGVEAVSLREISRESGARNAIATQYHFTDRAGVLAAIMAKHEPVVEAARHALLDRYEAVGGAGASHAESGAGLAGTVAGTSPAGVGIRDLAGALVRPLAAKLGDPDGGPEFLQIHAEILDRTPGEGRRGNGRGPVTGAGLVPMLLPAGGTSIGRWRALIDPLIERDAVRLHRRFTAIVHSAVELGRRARTGPHTDDRLFTSYLVDVVTAILSFPVSEETRRLADERDEARHRRGR
ncbi:MAG: TetR/AcrR family transcriptional regulator [Acidimicrobiales bacterium]